MGQTNQRYAFVPPPPKSRRRDSSQTKPDIEKMKDTKKSCLGLYMCAFEKNSDFWPWQPHFWYFLCQKYMFFANNFFRWGAGKNFFSNFDSLFQYAYFSFGGD